MSPSTCTCWNFALNVKLSSLRTWGFFGARRRARHQPKKGVFVLPYPRFTALCIRTSVLGPIQMFSHMQILEMASDHPLPVVLSGQKKYSRCSRFYRYEITTKIKNLLRISTTAWQGKRWGGENSRLWPPDLNDLDSATQICWTRVLEYTTEVTHDKSGAISCTR